MTNVPFVVCEMKTIGCPTAVREYYTMWRARISLLKLPLLVCLGLFDLEMVR